MKNKKIQVIGGSGFIGSRLISILDRKLCNNLDKNNSPFYPDLTHIGNIENYDQINLLKNSIVVLLAAEHKDNIHPSSLYYDVNVKGTKNVLDKMDELGLKDLIFTSSVAIYGLNKNNPSEKDPHDPFNHYGKSKWQAEELIRKWYNSDPESKSVTIIRPSVVFGERNRGNVFNLLKQISSGKFLMIGKGNNRKSMAYVGNLAFFIKYIIQENIPGMHIYNYSDRPDYTMNELTRVVEKKMNIKIPKTSLPIWIGMLGGRVFDLISFLSSKKFSISAVRIKKFCATTQFNSSKAHSKFDAPYTLDEGLKNTLSFEFINPPNDNILFYSE